MGKSQEVKAITNFFEIIEEEVKQLKKQLPFNELNLAKQLILDAERSHGRLHITGIGKPSYVAAYSASLFSSTGTPSYLLDGTEAIHGSSGQVKKQDVVLAISNSGETAELKKTVQTVKKNGSAMIGVGGDPHSWLAKESDVFLVAYAPFEGDDLNKPPRASIIAEILILQALSVSLQVEQHLTAAQYLQWHPGGSLGKAIFEEQKKGV